MALIKVSQILKRRKNLSEYFIDDSSSSSVISKRNDICLGLDLLGIDREEVKTLRVDEKNVIWICNKALSFSYDCCFALCGLCHDSNGSNSRKKRAKLDTDSCNHNILNPCVESKWFTKSYLEKLNEEEKRKFPTHCSQCLAKFLNK